jgi:nicotinamide mononucleotide transporter
MEEILTSLSTQSATQWMALITGLAYVILAAHEKPLCWPFGIVSCSLIAVDDFALFQLYADGVLQIFYVLFGFAGLYFWIFRNPSGAPLIVTSRRLKAHLIAVLALALISIPIALLLKDLTNAAYSYLDTLTTLLSLWATWLLVKKVLENWLYWIVIDAVYVVLFCLRGGELIALLYGIYMVIAVWGYLNWKHRQQNHAISV